MWFSVFGPGFAVKEIVHTVDGVGRELVVVIDGVTGGGCDMGVDADEAMAEEEDLNELFHGRSTGGGWFAGDFDGKFRGFVCLDGSFCHLGGVV